MNYLLIRNGTVENIVVWDGDCAAWQPGEDLVAVPCPNDQAVSTGWSAMESGGTWTFLPPEDSAADVSQLIESNCMTKDCLLEGASIAIGHLQDSYDIGTATDQQKSLLTDLKKYRLAINQVDISLPRPLWPSRPE